MTEYLCWFCRESDTEVLNPMHLTLCFACCSKKLCFVLKFVSCYFSNLHVFPPTTITPCPLSSFLFPLHVYWLQMPSNNSIRKQIETLQVSYHGYPQGILPRLWEVMWLTFIPHGLPETSGFHLSINETMQNSFITVLLKFPHWKTCNSCKGIEGCFIWGQNSLTVLNPKWI